jgi:hypothetical protein
LAPLVYLAIMLWVTGPSSLRLSSLSTGSGAAYVALSTSYTGPARGAAILRAGKFVTLCAGARVFAGAPCLPALDHITANPPSVVAYSFRVCHESEVFHGYERDRDQELLAYALTLVVASTSTSSARSSSGGRIRVVQAKPHRPPVTQILTLRAPLIS